jgi:hypothetical protein
VSRHFFFFLKLFLKRLPGMGSKPGSSRFHLFSHFSPLYRWATADAIFFLDKKDFTILPSEKLQTLFFL